MAKKSINSKSSGQTVNFGSAAKSAGAQRSVSAGSGRIEEERPSTRMLRASAGARTTVRVPPEIEPEVEALEGSGATRGAALQELLRAGAGALARERADATARNALRQALDELPREVVGHPADAEIERAIGQARRE